MIDRATVQRIKDTANILEVVSDYVHLTRRGANYMGLCPFHNERTPSFSVNVRRNFCWCFSCRKGGSPVNFIMEKEGLSYHDALLQLAKKYGIKVEERELTDEERAAQTERESLMVAMEWAADKMAQDLKDTEEGRDIGLTYFYERGITDEAIKAFKLGYAPDKHDYLSRLMLSHGFELDVLRKIGITGKTENGRIYDRYHGRVIFPITNSAGHVVALGGRDLKGGMAKYINSNDSVLYSKKNELYGISQARAEMKTKDRCYLVEGYFDVISMWQSGIKNVVASSGTALTDNQIHLIHRFTENITLIYDGDSAGIHAAIRGIDMLLQHKMKVKVLLLPDNHDPDSFARQNSSQQFIEYIRQHETDVIRFKMQVMLKNTENDIHARTQAINSICRTIAHIHDITERMLYIGECSRMLGIPQETLLQVVNKAREDVVNQYRRLRQHNGLNNLMNDGNPSLTQAEGHTTPGSATDNTSLKQETAATTPDTSLSSFGSTFTDATGVDNRKRHTLHPIEKDIVRYMVRYGYLPLTAESDMTVVEYIADELEADNITFNYEPYNKIKEALLEGIDEYMAKREEFVNRLNIELDEQRSKRVDEIAEMGLSISEIDREEKHLEQELNKMRTEQLQDFSKDYPGIILASHEDADIRSISTDLISEKHKLSNIYLKNTSELPEDLLYVNVPRAIIVLKNEMLEIQIKEMINELSELNIEENWERVKELQSKINKYTKFKSSVSHTIGDRIISPRFSLTRQKNNG